MKKPGRHDFTVIVTDAKGAKVSAAASVEVKACVVTIALARGGTPKVILGQTRSFQATVSSPDGLKPPAGLVYRWEPSTDVAFAPAEGPKNASTGKFTTLGKTRVWVAVLQKTGPTLTTVAESEPVEIDVAAPEISLVADTSAPYPGQAVRVTASETPAIANAAIVYTWEYAGDALNPGAEKNPRVYSFRPSNTKPVTVTARAKLKDGGLDLGSKSIVITAKPHGVSVSGPTPTGPKPQLWDSRAGGLVDVEGKFAVFQQMGLRADVTPPPLNQPLRYAWTVQPDGCTLSNPISQTPTVSCSKTGTFQVSVAVQDKLGAALGAGSGQVPITVSQRDLDSSQSKAAAAQKAAERAAQKARDDEAKRQAAAQKAAEQAAAKKAAQEEAARRAAEQAAQKQREEEATRAAAAKKAADDAAAKRAAEQAALKQREEQARQAAAAKKAAEEAAAKRAAEQAALKQREEQARQAAAAKKAADEAARVREEEKRQQQAELAERRILEAAIRTQSEAEAFEREGKLREAIASTARA